MITVEYSQCQNCRHWQRFVVGSYPAAQGHCFGNRLHAVDPDTVILEAGKRGGSHPTLVTRAEFGCTAHEPIQTPANK
jgi:hypothetical protein